MLSQLAGLPVPDRHAEKEMYGKFQNKRVFRYAEFLETMKYDPAYRHLLTARWRVERPALGASHSEKPKMMASGSQTVPKPAASRLLSLTPQPAANGLTPPKLAAKPASRLSAQGLGSRLAASRGLSGARPRGSAARPGNLLATLRAFDRQGQGMVTIEQVQEGLVACDLVPAAPNKVLLDLFQSCDRDGQGNIDYKQLATIVQAQEAAGQPIFVTGYNSSGGPASRMGGATRVSTGTFQATVQRLNAKHSMLKDALKRSDTEGQGRVPLQTLKDVLVSMNVISQQQLQTGELDAFLGEHTQGGMVDYNRFADSIQRDDQRQLESLRN